MREWRDERNIQFFSNAMKIPNKNIVEALSHTFRSCNFSNHSLAIVEPAAFWSKVESCMKSFGKCHRSLCSFYSFRSSEMAFCDLSRNVVVEFTTITVVVVVSLTDESLFLYVCDGGQYNLKIKRPVSQKQR